MALSCEPDLGSYPGSAKLACVLSKLPSRPVSKDFLSQHSGREGLRGNQGGPLCCHTRARIPTDVFNQAGVPEMLGERKAKCLDAASPTRGQIRLLTAAENTCKSLFCDLGLSSGLGESQASVLWVFLLMVAESAKRGGRRHAPHERTHTCTQFLTNHTSLRSQGVFSETLLRREHAAHEVRLQALQTSGCECGLLGTFQVC